MKGAAVLFRRAPHSENCSKVYLLSSQGHRIANSMPATWFALTGSAAQLYKSALTERFLQTFEPEISQYFPDRL